MHFNGLQAKYQRLHQESATWRLLRANNAPQILAFVGELFVEANEVPFAQARVALDAVLLQCQGTGVWESNTNAGTYLNQWINDGYLREMDNSLSKTDALEVATRFIKGLDERATHTSASHLRIVQDAVRDFTVAVSPDTKERAKLLRRQKAKLQQQLEDLAAGNAPVLSELEQRERIREIYQLASVLTGDFRRVEDDIRELDQALRVQMIEGDNNRGDVLTAVMDKEQRLFETDAGSAFESFFELLYDHNRHTEFRDQLNTLLTLPVSEYLSAQQQHYLGRLMRQLLNESDRVMKIRRRTEESLRAYIESGAAQENRAVNRLLGQLERLAVNLKEQEVPVRTPLGLSLPTGAVKLASPMSMQLKMPDDRLDTSGVEEMVNNNTPSDDMLASLDGVQVRELAHRTFKTLQLHGPMTIANVVDRQIIESGLEELVAYLRVAKAIGAPDLDDKEEVRVVDKYGHILRASIPALLLSAELFPHNIDELAI